MKPRAGFRTAALTAAILLGMALSVATTQAYTAVVVNDPIVSGQWDYVYPHEEYNVTVTGQAGQVTLKVEAEDFAGNKAEAQITATAAQETKTYTLSVATQPSGVQVLVNGNPKTTPYSETLPEGTYVVEAPPSATVSGKEYVFKQWSDGRTSTSAVTLNADASLTVVFEEKQAPQPEPSGGIPLTQSGVLLGLAGAALVYMRKQRKTPIL